MAILQGKKQTTTGQDVANVATVDQRVQHFADLLNAVEGFAEDLQALTDENENQKRSAFIVLCDMRAILEDEIDNLPVPGSVKGQTNNYDVYAKDPSKEMKGPNKGSFYNDLFDVLTIGAGIKSELDKIATNKELSDIVREERVGVLKARQTYGRSQVLKAARLHFQLKAIAELSEHGVNLAELSDMVDGQPVPRKGNKPFRLDDVNNREEFKRLSIDQVLNLEPAKAEAKFKEAGGKVSMYKCLLSTLKADKDTSTSPGQNAAAINTVTAFTDYIAEVKAFADKINSTPAIGSSWFKELTKADNKDLRENVAALAGFFDKITENKDFAALYRGDKSADSVAA